ncbi:MAG: 30S ribosomal protein S12 methylthiotransferase RimO [Oscillospiraceae bacterium]|nr:30S ribosomal protein S12 methylthiotransferase RimO [Oscillospiraceae bacterium]
MSKKITMVSLGCPKNQVDGEMMLGTLRQGGFEITDDPADADIIIINTCGFIESAKRESIENILDMASYKEDNPNVKILVTGCLAERYRSELFAEIPEVDSVIGIGANGDICKICIDILENKKVELYPSKNELPLDGDRVLTTPEYSAYLKIADGCSNHCTYCAIPSIRGEYRSRTAESILDEAKRLAEGGVKELIVVAQDTTRYGEDLYGQNALVPLLKSLSKIDGIEWIRLLYLYPERISDALIDEIAENEKIVKYLDIPVQHCNERILKLMNRHGNRQSLTELFAKLREKIPNVALRTTLIAGFPGESEDEFLELCEFVDELRFERMGCFAYSEEEGTPAAQMDGMLDPEVREERAGIINERQNAILDEINDSLIGETLETIVEGYDPYTDTYYGRTYMDAPEIDTLIYFTCGYELNDGDIVKVEVMNSVDSELTGEAI